MAGVDYATGVLRHRVVQERGRSAATAAIMAINCSGSTGFLTWALNPAARASSRSFNVVYAVTAIALGIPWLGFDAHNDNIRSHEPDHIHA